MKGRNKLLLILLLLLIEIEIVLRLFFGFCNTVLYREDSTYEYIALPDQHRYRFRNHISFNQESMRSPELDQTSIKILGFGDSVLNGGVMTDQDSLATTLLSDTLSKIQNRKIQFLNISSGSWGPDNCYAFLNKHGSYQATQLFLFVSSHDAFDNMDFIKTVGIDESQPTKQYPTAVYELFCRYIIPQLQKRKTGTSEINKRKEGSVFNHGFLSFAQYAKSRGIPLVIYLHCSILELKNKEYNVQGQEILDFVKAHQIKIIKDLDHGLKVNDYRDNIHFNNQGQKRMAMIVLKYLNQ